MKFERLYSLITEKYTIDSSADNINISFNNEIIGNISITLDRNAGRSPLVLNRLLDGQYEELYRINSIYVEESHRGHGFGYYLYLSALALHPNNWFYNSQAWPDAHRKLKLLQEKGLIELKSIYNKPVTEDIGPHIKKITKEGIEWLKHFQENGDE
jgi:GNAT superfamily N-acetyltransferase